jgi:hypothetical protein
VSSILLQNLNDEKLIKQVLKTVQKTRDIFACENGGAARKSVVGFYSYIQLCSKSLEVRGTSMRFHATHATNLQFIYLYLYTYIIYIYIYLYTHTMRDYESCF